MLNNNLIVPGSPNASIIRNRAGKLNGSTRMPPVATNIIDQEAVNLLTDWINSINGYQTYQQWRIAQFGNDVSPNGEPSENPDGDHATNQDEYNTQTDPLDGSSFWNPLVQFDVDSLVFENMANRSVLVETSTDLNIWHLLDVPENDGIPPASTVNKTIFNPLIPAGNGDRHFFRFLMQPR